MRMYIYIYISVRLGKFGTKDDGDGGETDGKPESIGPDQRKGAGPPVVGESKIICVIRRTERIVRATMPRGGCAVRDGYHGYEDDFVAVPCPRTRAYWHTKGRWSPREITINYVRRTELGISGNGELILWPDRNFEFSSQSHDNSNNY